MSNKSVRDYQWDVNVVACVQAGWEPFMQDSDLFDLRFLYYL